MRVACDRRNFPLLHLELKVARQSDLPWKTVLFGEPRQPRGIPSCGDACRSVETVCTGSVLRTAARGITGGLAADRETVRTHAMVKRESQAEMT